jgi:hypothetical protein
MKNRNSIYGYLNGRTDVVLFCFVFFAEPNVGSVLYLLHVKLELP